jgi:hypothetical protein
MLIERVKHTQGTPDFAIIFLEMEDTLEVIDCLKREYDEISTFFDLRFESIFLAEGF